ncbi:putative amid-like nadh protein [Eutypa lata UCREL1]|uniref:Putative amid-like nadh protein n=1 Tax=Eutypa lata (strain UCR-EL1) TaxID=1287681 RepID=M7SSD8_EUTLA|nr:putative amid-like nadh protein [Eutypa lata UCREL1]
MASNLKNVIVVGGSYVGVATTQGLANILPATHRPRFAVLPKYEHKAFVPYSATFSSSPNANQHAVVKARVSELHKNRVVLDREWQGSKEIPFDYLVVATGTRLQAPGTMEHDDKLASVKYFQAYQERVQNASSIAIVGGGAVGVQMATDLKELYPEKEITLVHSRNQLMPVYHEGLDTIIKERFAELGVKLVAGSRVIMPTDGFQNQEKPPTTIKLQNGTELTADLVIPAVGQTPNNQFLSSLPPTSPDSLINPANGFIRVRPTLQFRDPHYPHLYAVGDIADSGAHKAARPGVGQAQAVAKNVLAMVEGLLPDENVVVGPAAIHLTLGLTKNVIFKNPDKASGETEPKVVHKDDGKADMGIDGIWERRGITVKSPDEYHL